MMDEEKLPAKFWPVPESYTRTIPSSGESGSFWENRGDRHHAGVDLYAPNFAAVIATEDCEILETLVFTSPEIIPYWYKTYSVITRINSGLIIRYAEMGSISVNPGQKIHAGEPIGTVGIVLNREKIGSESPEYIQKLKNSGQSSMLHFEIHQKYPLDTSYYLGGNYFLTQAPVTLLNPSNYLAEINQTAG